MKLFLPNLAQSRIDGMQSISLLRQQDTLLPLPHLAMPPLLSAASFSGTQLCHLADVRQLSFLLGTLSGFCPVLRVYALDMSTFCAILFPVLTGSPLNGQLSLSKENGGQCKKVA